MQVDASIPGRASSGNVNSVAVTIDGYSLSAADLVALGALGRGDQDNPLDNQLVTITSLAAFTQVTFSSTDNAFEFSLGSGVPEPSTWAEMLIVEEDNQFVDDARSVGLRRDVGGNRHLGTNAEFRIGAERSFELGCALAVFGTVTSHDLGQNPLVVGSRLTTRLA